MSALPAPGAIFAARHPRSRNLALGFPLTTLDVDLSLS